MTILNKIPKNYYKLTGDIILLIIGVITILNKIPMNYDFFFSYSQVILNTCIILRYLTVLNNSSVHLIIK